MELSNMRHVLTRFDFVLRALEAFDFATLNGYKC
jgi:hypothetical protein